MEFPYLHNSHLKQSPIDNQSVSKLWLGN